MGSRRPMNLKQDKYKQNHVSESIIEKWPETKDKEKQRERHPKRGKHALLSNEQQ